MVNPSGFQEDKDQHREVLRMADDALVEAQKSIELARKKLRVAQRNYEDRMRLPQSAK